MNPVLRLPDIVAQFLMHRLRLRRHTPRGSHDQGLREVQLLAGDMRR